MSSAGRASSVPKPPRWLVEAPLPSQHLRQPLILFDERHLLLGRVKPKAGKPIAHESFIFVFVCFFQHLTSSLYPASPHSTPTQPQLLCTALHGGCGRTSQPEYLGRGMSGPLPNPCSWQGLSRSEKPWPANQALPRPAPGLPGPCPPAKPESVLISFQGI